MTLLERTLKQNPWWVGKEVEEIKTYKPRFLLSDVIKEHISDPQIIAILGLRRVGKSVILFQIIKNLIDSKSIPAKRILYFSFDEILGKDPDIIEKVIETYENDILRDDLKDVFIFFDEINHIENWQTILKRYYDLKSRIKFFVSGSSSIFLKRTKESLAGRIYEFELQPVSFKEYLYLKGIAVDDLTLQRLTLKKELNNYFLSGSLPELIREASFQKIKMYINSLIDKVIFFDLPKVYEVGEPEALKAIFSFIAHEPGMIIEYQSLSKNLGLSYQTVSKYVSYLEKSYLIRLVYNFRGSPIARARKLKKAYLGAINLGIGFMDREDSLLQNYSALAENAVCLALQAKWFWRKYTEADFYSGEKVIEVKYGDKKPDLKNTLLACKQLKAKELLVITKDMDEKEAIQGIEVTFTPLWKWLLE